MGLRDTNLYHILESNATKFASRPAVITPVQTLSYAEFLENVDRLAAGISNRGITKGERICILSQNSTDYLALYGACAKMGAIAYPINWRLSADEVAQVFRLAEPAMLAVGTAHLHQIEGLELDALKIRAILGQGSAPGFMAFDELYAQGGGESAEVGGKDPFVIISTAAVSGVPRGAVLTHSNMMLSVYPIISELELGPRDRQLAALPFFHITGLGLSLAVFQVGGANVVMESFDPAKAVHLMEEQQVTLLADFPPILAMLLDAKEASGAKWEDLKYVFGLDAPDVIERLHKETNAMFWTGFGQSETSGVATMGAVSEKPGSAGRAIALARLRCVDEEGRDVPTGEPGEIVVRGPLVFSGYWRDPDATNYTFRGGWHHTGDIGRLDDEDYLYYVGRMPEKDLIKSGGENIYPAEVEQVLNELPQVNETCVIGVPDPEWGETVKAIVELERGASMTEGEVVQAVVDRIASFKKPRHVVFVETLPRQDDGGIDRAAVKEQYG